MLLNINIGYILFQVFRAALFVHELDKHELFGVDIVGHTLWCGTIIVVVIVNNIMTLQHKQ